MVATNKLVIFAGPIHAIGGVKTTRVSKLSHFEGFNHACGHVGSCYTTNDRGEDVGNANCNRLASAHVPFYGTRRMIDCGTFPGSKHLLSNELFGLADKAEVHIAVVLVGSFGCTGSC